MRLWGSVNANAPVLSVIATIVVALSVLVIGAAADTNLDHVFRDRSLSEWKEAWHHEKYARCRQTLLRHLEWACEKDIYRITRRSSSPYQPHSQQQYPVISAMEAHRMLRWRRGGRGGNSITAECCSSAGCTWEEYAEYCPTNKRRAEFMGT